MTTSNKTLAAVLAENDRRNRHIDETERAYDPLTGAGLLRCARGTGSAMATDKSAGAISPLRRP